MDVDVIEDGTFTGRALPAVLPSAVAAELRPLLEIRAAQLLAVGDRRRPGFRRGLALGAQQGHPTY